MAISRDKFAIMLLYKRWFYSEWPLIFYMVARGGAQYVRWLHSILGLLRFISGHGVMLHAEYT
jgi:hypothetical protein